MNLWKIFGVEKEQDSKFGTLFSRLEEILDDLEERDCTYITALSGLLGKVANSDLDISKEELSQIETILTQFGLSTSQAATVVKLVRELTKELAGIEDYRYTRMLNDILDREKKLQVIDCLFSVAAANKSISAEEDNEIGKVAEGLLLLRKDFIDVRSKYREHLDVLKDLPKR